MKEFILILLALSVSQTLFGSDSFSDYFEYSSSRIPQHANEITLHFTESPSLSNKQRLSLFKQFNNAISLQIEKEPNSAVLWFSKGLNFKNRLDTLEEKFTLGTKNIEPVIQQTKDFMQQSFIKAMLLDDVKKPKLTARMYGTMKHNLSENNRINALQKELSQGGSGDNESHYWFTHWDVIGSLQEEGRFEEAEKALYQLKKELIVSGLEDSDFNQVYQQAKTHLAQDHQLSKTLETKLTKPPANKTRKNTSTNKPLFDTIKSKIETYWFMILLNIFIIISLIYAFMKREKN